jgi:malonyl-ACP O-methyltransferase BioC
VGIGGFAIALGLMALAVPLWLGSSFKASKGLFLRIIGMEIAFAAFLALIHTAFAGADEAAFARARVGGGAVGWTLAHGMWALTGGRASQFVCGDLNALPFAGVAFDLVWSNLALQWVNDLPRAFTELRRVMKVGGLLTFTTFGPDTLREVRKAFARVDGFTHTNRFADMHDVGDMLLHAGFADPVMDMETLTVTYPDPESLLRELKALGASNVTRGRAHGLMGRHRWQKMLRALDAMRTEGRLPATFEVIYGHAWKGEPTKTEDGLPVVRFRKP